MNLSHKFFHVFKDFRYIFDELRIIYISLVQSKIAYGIELCYPFEQIKIDY